MGGDYYDREVVTTSSTAGYSTESKNVVGVTKSLHSSMNPTRWAEENLQCENLDPIVFALDVTGSMGNWTRIIYDKMPMFYGQIMMQNYLKDPAISFCAIGDVTCDKAPLQITEFGQGKEIDQLISKMWLEGGGGGSYEESYELPAYFYSTHVDLLNPEFPFFFVTGDEAFYEKIPSNSIQKVFGEGIKGKEINSRESWSKLKEMYNVFLIKKPYANSDNEKIILKQWTETLGAERVLKIETPKACIDVMLGAIAITSGVRDLPGYVKDMKDRGQTDERIEEVTKALKVYADKLSKNQIKVIRHEPKNIEVTNSKTTTTTTTTNVKAVSSEEIQEIVELAEKLLIQDLDEDSTSYRNNLKKLKETKGESIPKEFICPLTKEVLFDPVMTADGHSFERKAIECWLDKHEVSPVTGVVLDSKSLLPNFALKTLIKDYYNSSI